jgi:hypothetical protein
VCKLRKSQYGLKSTPRAWYEKIDKLFLHCGFKCCESYHSISAKHVNGESLYIVLYTDDLVPTRSNNDFNIGLKAKLKDTLMLEF